MHAEAHEDDRREIPRAGSAAEARGSSIGARFSTAERRWAVEYARQPGVSANREARALGVSDVTMRIWIRAAKPAATLRPVVVSTDGSEQHPRRPRAPSKAPMTLTFRTAQGHELGPLDVETAVSLLRALS
ncbi:MAG: hypothetical protein JWN04_3442 [Myxococcaceae bacterium]|nr:hypothetical protein [Myxococcaceae bacterium]